MSFYSQQNKEKDFCNCCSWYIYIFIMVNKYKMQVVIWIKPDNKKKIDKIIIYKNDCFGKTNMKIRSSAK